MKPINFQCSIYTEYFQVQFWDCSMYNVCCITVALSTIQPSFRGDVEQLDKLLAKMIVPRSLLEVSIQRCSSGWLSAKIWKSIHTCARIPSCFMRCDFKCKNSITIRQFPQWSLTWGATLCVTWTLESMHNLPKRNCQSCTVWTDFNSSRTTKLSTSVYLQSYCHTIFYTHLLQARQVLQVLEIEEWLGECLICYMCIKYECKYVCWYIKTYIQSM